MLTTIGNLTEGQKFKILYKKVGWFKIGDICIRGKSFSNPEGFYDDDLDTIIVPDGRLYGAFHHRPAEIIKYKSKRIRHHSRRK
jgi:hypothetical protein